VTTENAGHPEVPNGHAYCFICGDRNPRSLGLTFRPVDADTVCAEFQANPELQGYDGILHGGVIAALLDAAMTHCLFHRGIEAITGDLHVRFLHPVSCHTLLEVRARALSMKPPLYRVEAQLAHGPLVLARAEATFMRR
jgi:uncharacterized protein (TIGR00369 family)